MIVKKREIISKVFSALMCCLLSAAVAAAQVFELTQTAIAGGGISDAAGGVYSISSTTGQSAAGNALRSAPYSMTVGFWNADILSPTAANVSLAGRVITADGNGIRNVRVTLEGGALSAPRYTLTGPFGYYRIDNLRAGETCVLTVSSKRYVFAQPSILINLTDEFTEANFISEPR